MRLLTLLITLLLAACGPSDAEKIEVATVTCNLIKSSRGFEGTLRLKEVNEARKTLGKGAFLGTDLDVLQAIAEGLCFELVTMSDREFENYLNAKEEKRKAAAYAAQRKIDTKKDRLKRERNEERSRDELIVASGRELSFDELMSKGDAVYKQQCLACHGADGEGGVGNAIAGSAVALGKISKHLDVGINGVTGTAMQAFGAQLTDVEMAAVITYQRNAFGNNTEDIIQPIDVRNHRGGIGGSKSAISGTDLGEAYYGQCVACHGGYGEGGIGPKLKGASADEITMKLNAYRNGAQLGGQSAMMWAVAKPMGDADIANLAAYITTL